MTKAEMVKKFGPYVERYEECRADAVFAWELLCRVGDDRSRFEVLKAFWGHVNLALEAAAELVAKQQEELEKFYEKGGRDDGKAGE